MKCKIVESFFKPIFPFGSCTVKPSQDLRPYYIVFLELDPTPDEDSLADIPLNKVSTIALIPNSSFK